MAAVTIEGTYYHRTGWVASNWSRMETAHGSLSGLIQGTFNVQITGVATGDAGSQTWTGGSIGDLSWFVPTGVTRIKIECYGGGGNVDFPYEPGGGGGYAKAMRNVTEGDEIIIECYHPGTGPRVHDPDFTWAIEGGGNIGPFGSTGMINIDDGNFEEVITYKGGDAGSPSAANPEEEALGGGGGGAGPDGDGMNGGDATGSTGGSGGASGGGLAGAGGKGADLGGDGDNGSDAGGGGGGGVSNSSTGGYAAVVISWGASIEPASTWTPPDDDTYRQSAHDAGVTGGNQYSNGSDFLFKGNYIHPGVTINKINGNSIGGSLYYAGSPDSFTTGSPLEPGAITRDSLEILSSSDIASTLGVTGGETITVELDDGT